MDNIWTNFNHMSFIYILRGGFKLSIITDKYQFIIVLSIILFSIFLILGNLEINSYELN